MSLRSSSPTMNTPPPCLSLSATSPQVLNTSRDTSVLPAADRPLSPLALCEVSNLHLGCSSLEELSDSDPAVQGACIYPHCPETPLSSSAPICGAWAYRRLPHALKQHPAVIWTPSASRPERIQSGNCGAAWLFRAVSGRTLSALQMCFGTLTVYGAARNSLEVPFWIFLH